MTLLLMGQILQFVDNPFNCSLGEAVKVRTKGAIAVDDGRILDVGEAADLKERYPEAKICDHGQALLSAGFVDSHVHYAQTAIINSWGKRLIDWLNDYTFPEEARFDNQDYAVEIARRYFSLTLSHGTTTACSYGTVHPQSVEAYFSVASEINARALCGKTCMDRNAPENIRDCARSAYDDSKQLIEKWHGIGRNHYVITPRFAPTSTSDQLSALGSLWQENPSCLMQTHLSEQVEEVAWVRELFPTAKDYLDCYEQHGLIGKGALFGHAIWLEAREKDRLVETNSSLLHCPTSNSFLGSGIFDLAGLKAAKQNVGIATDTGGGSSFSMLRTMAATYELSQLNGHTLHPAQLWWLATLGNAKALHLDHCIGNIAVGMDADIIAIDLGSTEAIKQRQSRAEDFWEALFPTIMMGDDRAIQQVYIAGQKVPLQA